MAGPNYPRVGSAKFTKPKEYVPPREHWLGSGEGPMYERERQYYRDLAVKHYGVDPNITAEEFESQRGMLKYGGENPYWQHGEGPSTTGYEGTEPWHQPSDTRPDNDPIPGRFDRLDLQRKKAQEAWRADSDRNFNAMWARERIQERPQEGEERRPRGEEDQPFLEGAPTEGGLGGDEPDEEEDFWDNVAGSLAGAAGLDRPQQGESEARQQSIPGQAPQSLEGPTTEERAARTRGMMEARKNLTEDEFAAYRNYAQQYPSESVDWRMFGRGPLSKPLPGYFNAGEASLEPPDIGPTAALAAAALSGPAAIMALTRAGAGGTVLRGGGRAVAQPAKTAGREGIAGAERTALREAMRPGGGGGGGGQDPNVLPFKMTRDAARRLGRMP